MIGVPEQVRRALGMLRAKWALRRCAHVGRGVRVRGRPRIDAGGRIEIESNVSIHAYLARTQLSAGRGALLSVGKDTFINNGAVLSARKEIRVGSGCQIATGVVVLDSDFHDPEDLRQIGASKPVVIEDDVWLATRAMILKGVRVGRGSVIAAGAVVTKDVPADTLVGGVPARPIRSLRRSSEGISKIDEVAA